MYSFVRFNTFSFFVFWSKVTENKKTAVLFFFCIKNPQFAWKWQLIFFVKVTQMKNGMNLTFISFKNNDTIFRLFCSLWKFWGYSSTSSKRNLCCGLDYDLVNCLILCEFKGFTKCWLWFWTTFWTCSKNILQWSIQHSLDSYNCGKHKAYDLLITSWIPNPEFWIFEFF